MIELMQNLLKLQELEFGEGRSKKIEEEMNGLRAKILPQILGHYDRLVARGKKGVALVRNQVCTGCYMKLPIGTINTLMLATDIQICDTCGRYLWLAPAPPEPPQESKPEKTSSAPRKRRKSAPPKD